MHEALLHCIALHLNEPVPAHDQLPDAILINRPAAGSRPLVLFKCYNAGGSFTSAVRVSRRAMDYMVPCISSSYYRQSCHTTGTFLLPLADLLDRLAIPNDDPTSRLTGLLLYAYGPKSGVPPSVPKMSPM